MNGVLPELEQRIEHMPRLQVAELQERLHHVEVMEEAMRRNVHEVLESGHAPEVERVRKLKSLAKLIESEVEELRHETDFMAMGYESTLDAVSKAADKLVHAARELLLVLRANRPK